MYNFLLSHFFRNFLVTRRRIIDEYLLNVRQVVLQSRASRLGFLRFWNRACARGNPLGRCSILQRSRDESWFTGESNGEGNGVPEDFKNSPATLSPTPINSISRYFAASRRAMDITLFLTFRPPCSSIVFLSSARFFFCVERSHVAQRNARNARKYAHVMPVIWTLDEFSLQSSSGHLATWRWNPSHPFLKFNCKFPNVSTFSCEISHLIINQRVSRML